MPDHREVKYAKCDAATLREMIDKTLFSVSSDETRFHLNGVFFECDGAKARMVSTDGHRLSKVERTLTGGPALEHGVIIPKKGLVEIKRALEGEKNGCDLAIQGPYVFLRTGDVALALKLIESQFPPYEQVIPRGNDHVVFVDREALLEALKRASLMSSETRGVRFTVDGGVDGAVLRVTSDNPELGEVREDLDVEYKGPAISVGFNPRYFTDVLTQMTSDRIRIELAGELDPAVVKPGATDDYLGVVMPMRI
jgi:DNA polymerase-3 subunit beta